MTRAGVGARRGRIGGWSEGTLQREADFFLVRVPLGCVFRVYSREHRNFAVPFAFVHYYGHAR